MKLKHLILSLCVFATVASYAQKVDLDRYYVDYTYRNLPENPLPKEYNTFNVTVNATGTVRNNYPDDQVKNLTVINGWKKVDLKGHVTINYNFSDLFFTGTTINDRVEIIKDKDGKETGRKHYYSLIATYTWDGNYNVVDYQGKMLRKAELANRNNVQRWTSSEYENSREAYNVYNGNINEIKSKLIRDNIQNSINSVNGFMDSQYGFPIYTRRKMFWIMDSKKHPEQDAQQAAWTKLKDIVIANKGTDDIAVVRQSFQPVISYFDDLIAKTTGSEKNDKKLRYGAYYALGYIYLMIDQPDMAIKNGEALIANDYDKGDGKDIIKDAEQLKKSFEKNGLTTRYFKIDVSKFTPPTN